MEQKTVTDQDSIPDIDYAMVVLGLCYGAVLLGSIAALAGLL